MEASAKEKAEQKVFTEARWWETSFTLNKNVQS